MRVDEQVVLVWRDVDGGGHDGLAVMRHADAGYDIAKDCARENGLDLPMLDAVGAIGVSLMIAKIGWSLGWAGVRELVDILRAASHDPWFDHRLQVGRPWEVQLLEAIRACDCFLYALTPESVERAAQMLAQLQAHAPAPWPEPVVAEMDLQQLRRTVAVCRRCPLHESRTQAVFGVGSPSADWMIIGEAPGAEEDRLGEPFVGRAGQLLDAMLKALGQSRETVYIANVLKCRPPGNRDPQDDEAAACAPFLDRQIELIAPRVIVALGKPAARIDAGAGGSHDGAARLHRQPPGAWARRWSFTHDRPARA